MAGVAVGPATRAWREGVRPGGSVSVGPATRAYQQAGGYGSFTRSPAGSVAVGTATRAARLGYPGAPASSAGAPGGPAASSGAAPGFQQPPIPTGAYNPIRDIELNAGKRGLSNTLEDIGTEETRGASNYQLATERAQRERANSLATINRSFQRLGVQQAERENGAGVLYGGAALASAARRHENQGLAEKPVQEGYELTEGANALGRQREVEDHTKVGSRAEREQGQFGIDTETLKAREAADNGYRAPTGPMALLFNRVNPANGEHYREYKKGGKTVHEYHSGRKVEF